MDYKSLNLLKDKRDDERIVTIQHQDTYDSLEDALGDGFVFRQGNRSYQNYEANFDRDDYPEVEHWFVLDVYEHDGIVYSLTGEGPQCQFDTARGGAILGITECDNPETVARYLLKGINSYANGEVYWFSIEDGHGNLLDGCGGFIGQDDVVQEVQDILGSLGGEVTELRDDAEWLL